MKTRLTSLFLLVTILMQVFSAVVIVIGYELNKDYISKTLCENKDKPLMNCNGKCHMNKVLAKEESNQKTSTFPLKEKIGVVSYFQEFNAYIFNIETSKSCFNSYYLTRTLPQIIIPIYIPPS